MKVPELFLREPLDSEFAADAPERAFDARHAFSLVDQQTGFDRRFAGLPVECGALRILLHPRLSQPARQSVIGWRGRRLFVGIHPAGRDRLTRHASRLA